MKQAYADIQRGYARQDSGRQDYARSYDPSATGAAGESAHLHEVRTIYREHGRFVWLSLQRLGIQPSDLDDVAQDVFMIVHRRLDTFDRRARVSTWLFGICMRVAANYRRRRRWTRPTMCWSAASNARSSSARSTGWRSPSARRS